MDNNRLSILWIAALIILSLMLASVTVLPVLASHRSGNLLQEQPYKEIDTYIEKQLSALNVPGAILAVVEGDEVVHTKSYGVINPAKEAPTLQTPFFIGSNTKSITALAIMQLVEAGKVALDAPVQRFLPWFTLADSEAAAQITVRHLLNQTSGLSQVPGMMLLANFEDSPGVSERQARALATVSPIARPGSVWEYSNVNYNLLGLVVEAAGGETYADYVQNHIFAPLEMRHSYTSKSTAQHDGLAVGHQMWFGFPVAVPNQPVLVGSLSSGQLISSAEDIAHYLIAQLNQGRYGDVQVLSPEGIAQMHQPAGQVQLFGESKEDYGMGWFVKEATPGTLIYHYGQVPDSFAYMALLSKQNRAMILLVNANEQMYNFSLLTMGENVALWLADLPPKSDAWGILPWVLRALILLPVIQITFIVATLRRVKHWRQEPSTTPSRARIWFLHILTPAILNLILVLIGAALVTSGLLNFMLLYMGDIVSLLLLSAAIALVWIFVRTPVILKTLPSANAKRDAGK